MDRQRIVWLVWGFVYLACVSGIVMATWRGRQSAIATYDSAEGKAEWGEWKEAAEEMAVQGGTLARRPPKGNELPALVLLRDHFATCLAGLIIAFTALFAVLVVLVRGAFGARPETAALSEADERRQRGL